MKDKQISGSQEPTNNRRSRLLAMICQFRPTPANPLLNAIKIVDKMVKARKKGARLIIFGETALQGYSIFDELKNPEFYEQSTEALSIIRHAAEKLKIAVILGCYKQNMKKSEKWANNTVWCFVPRGISKLQAQEFSQNKVLIPFEKELTENLYVQEGSIEDLEVITLDDFRIGFNICQDSWQALSQVRRFKFNPVDRILEQDPDIFINISSSPFYLGKTDDMIYNVLSKISRDHQLPVLYIGIVGLDGGQLLLGGYSQVLYNGEIYRHMKLFEEDDLLIDLKKLHELPQTRKPQKMFSSVEQRKKRHFQAMNSAFQSVFYYLCLKHNIVEDETSIEDKTFESCFKDIASIRRYIDVMRQDTQLYAKNGFVFHFDGSPNSVLLAHILSLSTSSLPKPCLIVTDSTELSGDQKQFLSNSEFEILETAEGDLVQTVDYLTHEKQYLPLDTYCFSDYMLGTIPRLVFGLAPLGSISYSLIYDLLAEYSLMKMTSLTYQEIDDQLVVDTILQSFLQNGKDFKSVLLKSFPVYYDYMSRFGQVSDIAESFLEYLLSIFKKYHNAMNNVSHRINPSTIIQLTWYSPNRYKYVNHALSVSDWYIRQAFEGIKPQLENW